MCLRIRRRWPPAEPPVKGGAIGKPATKYKSEHGNDPTNKLSPTRCDSPALRPPTVPPITRRTAGRGRATFYHRAAVLSGASHLIQHPVKRSNGPTKDERQHEKGREKSGPHYRDNLERDDDGGPP